MTSSREVALELLKRVFEGGAYANLLLPKLLREAKLEARDAALAQELAFGSIRWKATLDEIICTASGRSESEIDRVALLILELGTYQLLFTRIPNHAAINESVEQTKVHAAKATAFVNAVLRKVSTKNFNQWIASLSQGRGESQRLALVYSHPEWIVQALKLALMGDSKTPDLEALLNANNKPAPVNLAALPGICRPADLANLDKTLASPIGFSLESGDPGALEAVTSGRMRVQDAGSQLVALALVRAKQVAPGEKWLDLCAGPGGKAALLAAIAATEQATLVANEISPHRAKLVEESLANSGLTAKVTVQDGTKVSGNFDRILIDAPCTGLGALRRRPEARWRKKSGDLAQLAALQRDLLSHAWTLLKPGGVLLYATCSPHPAETTAVVDALLRSENFDGELLNANEILNRINPALEMPEERRTAQLWPHVHQTDAMFMAILQKPLT